MKGVEKGYRLVQQGKPDCTPFTITKVPDVSGLQNVPIPVKVHYKGYPQFAVTAKVEIVSCPSGWTCSGGTISYPTIGRLPLELQLHLQHQLFKACSDISPQDDADGLGRSQNQER